MVGDYLEMSLRAKDSAKEEPDPSAQTQKHFAEILLLITKTYLLSIQCITRYPALLRNGRGKLSKHSQKLQKFKNDVYDVGQPLILLRAKMLISTWIMPSHQRTILLSRLGNL